MAAITAAAVKGLRERTGLPMMKCKQALTEAGGDEEKAIEILRKEGEKTMAIKAAERTTAFGRFGVYAGIDKPAGAMVELNCESAPVAGHEEFIQMCNDLAQALAESSGVTAVDELLALKSPSKTDMTLKEQLDELYGRMREVFKVGRFLRYEGSTGGYSHNSGTVSGVLLKVEGGTDEAAKDVAMHVAAVNPQYIKQDDVPAEVVEKEKAIFTAQAEESGKPPEIIEKMIGGRINKFLAEISLVDQPFVKDPDTKVGALVKKAGAEIVSVIRFEVGEGIEKEEVDFADEVAAQLKG